MAFCQNCGSQLSAGARFCTNCGEGIAGAAQPSAPEPPPQAPYQTATLPYQPDPHGGAQGSPQAQRAEIKELFFTI